MNFFVLREPIVQEDEGRYELIGAFMTIEEVRECLVAQTQDGYYHTGDFIVTIPLTEIP